VGTLRLEPARIGGLSSRAVNNVWAVFDVQLALYAMALVTLGLLMAFTNSDGPPLAAGSLFTRGLMWLSLAIVAFTIAAAVDYRWLRTFVWPIYLINLGLLVATLLVGSGVGGVSRWVTIGPLQFQFSEVAKILMAVVLANWIASRPTKVVQLSTLLGAAVVAGPPLVLVLIQPDLGTSLVFGAIGFGCLFVAGANLRWMGLAVVGFVAALPIIWTEILKDYQRQRLVAFLDPEADPLVSGFQLLQSQIAVSTGGLFGKGLTGAGSAGVDYLPVSATDFVFARLGEELGFVGGAVMLVIYSLLLWRVLRIGWRSRDLFGLAFAGGVGAMLLFQLMVNVGMVLGIMPITGIPLPFVTHGGASLVSIAIGLGILESIAMRQGRPSD
jgi:rod shape determining protein RodA